MPPRVLHLSTYDTNGGAARAAYALHRAMVDSGIESRLLVGRSGTGDPTVHQVSQPRFRAASELDRVTWRLQRSANDAWRSPARFGALSADWINASGADIVNLHWVTDGFLSVREIGRITKPIVWSLVDMWPFSGTEHYGADTADARWRAGYTRENRSPGDSGIDLDRLTWERKSRMWTRPMHVVAASTWMHDRVEASALFQGWPVTRIPHVIDSTAFQPADQRQARSRLALPAHRPVVLFMSSGGITDDRKGWDLLRGALPHVQEAYPDLLVAVAGPAAPDSTSAAGMPIVWLGHVAGDAALRETYAAADVVAVPSREDNMPLVAMEAQTSGRPVVAFRIGGLPDIVEHGVTGYLASPFDLDDMATGLQWSLEDSRGDRRWSTASRARAVRTWSPETVVAGYLALYDSVMA
ncbi:MAG: glycosyltransferase [Actinomycetota bacterium]|nr:glycosyltransferase [Actinomycetota bacterium]